VVKLGKAFSILVVFTLLILLAPAMVLTPVGSVAANGGVVQEVEANFTFNESDVVGEWWPFIAGSKDIDAKGLCLAQYSRENVLRSVTLADCGFRNYTAGSGTVSGDLSGTMWVSWITVNFSQKYSHTPLYHDYGETAHFGWAAGRGHFYGGGDNNFTFVFVLDFDSDADMTNAEGKGFMLSNAEYNGTFAGHKIIGDFDVLIENGSDYTWNLHLRNYDPSEVHYLGIVTVEGYVLQEPTDNITWGLDLLSFNEDGPKPTQTVNHTTDFEEIAWGREPIKNVTGGPMGAGAKMDLSRNNALYLHIDTVTHEGETWIGIQGTPACNLHIDDTYNQTGDDGSTYGDMWYILLLDLPFQYLQMVAYPYNFFEQTGYTFTPFGLTNTSTDWYSGRENYADAFIQIEAFAGTAHQQSTDDSYGLYPHPKVESVALNQSLPDATMDVTITGKYFLRVAGEKSGWVNNSGSVDFGDNITVNHYNISTDNPIDNSITVNITIAANATPGVRDVNVTACFSYSNGTGTAPYLSGHGVFTVTGETGTLAGNAGFYRAKSIGDPTWVTPLEVSFFDNSSGLEAGWSPKYATTDAEGNFTVDGIALGTWDIGIKNYTTHSKMVMAKVFTIGNTTAASFGTLIEADCDDNDKTDGSDYAKVLNNYNARKIADPGAWVTNELWKADYTRDEKIDGSDFASVLNNYNGRGDIFYYTH